MDLKRHVVAPRRLARLGYLSSLFACVSVAGELKFDTYYSNKSCTSSMPIILYAYYVLLCILFYTISGGDSGPHAPHL